MGAKQTQVRGWIVIGGLGLGVVSAAAQGAIEPTAMDPAKVCETQFKAISSVPDASFSVICSHFKIEPKCQSVNGEWIPHYEKAGANPEGKRILVVGQIHGDEKDSGTLAFNWLERIQRLNPQNTWRIIPRANPDGFKKNIRTNINGVDLNRNFPTKDWKELAQKHWGEREKKNPRRFPGHEGGQEPETQCLMAQIEEYKPDLIISIHTPYAVLDFDGELEATKKAPKFGGLPWKSLGTFVGSLGRYMWVERQVPVLTVELKSKNSKSDLAAFNELQDFASYLSTTKK